MIRSIILLSIVAVATVSVVAQREICPTINVMASAAAVYPGEKVTFHVTVTGGSFDLAKLKYQWTTKPVVEIGDGQGSDTIVVAPASSLTSELTASVAVSPLGQCPYVGSKSAKVVAFSNPGGSGGGMGSGPGKGKMPDLSDGTPEPPKSPLVGFQLLSKPAAMYSKAACDANISGTVLLRVTFLNSGKIGAVSAIKGLPFGLTENAIAAAKLIKFEPAKRDGVPTTTTKALEYTFRECSTH